MGGTCGFSMTGGCGRFESGGSLILARLCVLAFAGLLSGCNGSGLWGRAPEFRDYYAELREKLPEVSTSEGLEPLVSVSASGMPLTDFLRYLSDECNVSVIAAESLDGREVAIEVKGESVSRVLGVVARRLGVQASRVGKLYFLGDLRPEDRGVMVRRVRRMSGEDLDKAVHTLLSETGRVFILPDGLVCLGDRVECLERVSDLLDQIEASPVASWVVQVFLLTASKSSLVGIGDGDTEAVDLAYTFAWSSAGGLAAEVKGSLDGAFNAVLRASREKTAGGVVAEPLFVLLDGVKAEMGSGEQIPVARRSVSDQGTVSAVGLDTVKTGLQVSCLLREYGSDSARLDLDISLSELVRMVGEYPLTSERSLKTSVPVRAGGVYLVGQLSRDEASDRSSGLMGLGGEWSNGQSTVQVWMRAYRVAGPVIAGVPNSSKSIPEGFPEREKLGGSLRGDQTPLKSGGHTDVRPLYGPEGLIGPPTQSEERGRENKGEEGCRGVGEKVLPPLPDGLRGGSGSNNGTDNRVKGPTTIPCGFPLDNPNG